MKKLILTACALTCAVSVFAQGQVQFNNRISATSLQTHIYMSPANVTSQMSGNGATDFPKGSQDWTGFTALLGSGYKAALMVNYGGTGVPTFSTSTDFRATAAAAGYLNGIVATLQGVAVNTSVNLSIFAWETKGTYTDPSAAWAAWKGALTAGGVSKTIAYTTGGDQFTPGPLTGLESFNIYTVPEPSTMALAGLGAAALLIFRRRS